MPFAANSRKPPDPVVFFLDRTLGKNVFADALRKANLEVRIHDEHFSAGEKDETWLRDVGQWRWVVVTNDKKIRYRHNELAALLRNAVRAFVFTSGNLTGKEMAEVFLKALPKISRLLEKHQEAFVATISRAAAVRIVSIGIAPGRRGRSR